MATEAELKKWLTDIRERKLEVVTIICKNPNPDYGNHFYGLGADSKEEFVKQLRQLADNLENPKYKNDFIKVKLSLRFEEQIAMIQLCDIVIKDEIDLLPNAKWSSEKKRDVEKIMQVRMQIIEKVKEDLLIHYEEK